MPNRILREGILTSERLEGLSWPEEVFYRRLMSVVDDFGRYYARPALLRAACYPLLLTKVSDSDIEKWLSVCENAALVRVYPASDGKRYLQMLDFRQQVRATASKFPQECSECVADAHQGLSNSASSAHLVEDVSEDVSESAQPRGFAEFWTAYPKKKSKGDAEKAFKAIKPSEQIVADMLQAIDLAKTSDQWLKNGGEFIPHPATWLRAKGWEDEHASTAKPWEN